MELEENVVERAASTSSEDHNSSKGEVLEERVCGRLESIKIQKTPELVLSASELDLQLTEDTTLQQVKSSPVKLQGNHSGGRESKFSCSDICKGKLSKISLGSATSRFDYLFNQALNAPKRSLANDCFVKGNHKKGGMGSHK